MTRSIVYLSNVNNDIFPDNTNSEFKSLLAKDTFKDIHPNNILLVGIRRLSFTITQKHSVKVIGINSNIVKKHQIVNSNLFQLLWTFCLPSNVEEEEEDENNQDSKLQPKTLEIINENPIYCQSSIEALKTASFQIFDTNTNKDINDLLDQTLPTVIEICYKTMSSAEDDSHFNVFVNSDHLESEKTFNDNNNMDFSILLPKTRQLENKWGVILRDLTMTNQFENVEENLYSIKYIEYDVKFHFGPDGFQIPIPDSKGESKTYGPLFMKSGLYTSKKQFLNEVNRVLKNLKASFIMVSTYFEGNKIKIKRQDTMIDNNRKRGKIMKLSYRLAVALGFMQPTNDKNEQKNGIRVNLTGIKEDGIDAQYPENINYFYPRQIVINCDLLSNSSIGNKQSRVLHLINITEIQGGMIKLNMKNTIIRDLDVHSFHKIRFWITNLEGEKLNVLSSMPTSLSLTFLKI